MSLETVHLFIQDLLHVLNEKLGLECTRIREILSFHAVPAASLRSEVSRCQPILTPMDAAVRSDSSGFNTQIDGLEIRAHDVLRFVFSLRNTLRPVNRLPPEILSRIARDVRDEFKEDTRAIIPLTHVCQYWRESIVSTPENWTTISGFRRNLAVASLERAKAAPLKIHLDLGRIQDHQFLDLLVPHFQNTETLWVTGVLTVEDLSFSKHPMTNLRSLMLLNHGVGDWVRSADPFESSAYTLQYLKLLTVPFYPSFLSLRTLTGLNLDDNRPSPHLDTLLDFLEENRSLTSAKIRIRFKEPSLRSSRHRVPIGNQLQYLRISCYDTVDGQTLISGIALSKGAELEFIDYGAGVNDVLSGVSTTHLSNLLSPTFMRYRVCSRFIELQGPNGAASFHSESDLNDPFAEFPRLPLANIQRFYLDTSRRGSGEPFFGSVAFRHLSSFPSLETFIIKCKTSLLHLLFTSLSNPSASPSLETLAFLDCTLTEEFMKELTRFAFDRKKTASVWLHRVVIIHSK